jgi:hypothetical protein
VKLPPPSITHLNIYLQNKKAKSNHTGIIMVTNKIKQKDRAAFLALSWIVILLFEFIIGNRKNSNRAVGILMSAIKLIKRTALIGLLVANVFMAISLIEEKKEN